MKKILHIVGARPNFMKMAPVWRALQKHKISQLIVHTGQHYSQNMSGVFFEEFGIPIPKINLRAGSGTQTEQVAKIMVRFEKILVQEKPDLVLVYGDVNSTLAASLVSAKLGLKTAHVEAGLRSGDLSMPEEINRIVTDRLSSLFFTPSEDADANLIKEGTDNKKIHLVGNVMIDTLIGQMSKIKNGKVDLPFPKYAVVTLHRPSNVDDLDRLEKIGRFLNKISEKIPLVFPIHPRTKKQLGKIKNLRLDKEKIVLLEPQGYLEFLKLVYNSTMVLTDSGGIQEETTHLSIPCLTMRQNTERPITVSRGTNTLVGDNFKLTEKLIDDILNGKYKTGQNIPRWDGKAAERIISIILKHFKKS